MSNNNVKVGDTVRRINSPWIDAKVDQEATVTRVGRCGSVDVEFTVDGQEKIGRGWLVENYELVKRAEEKYTFKVGDEGKTRDGRSFKVIARAEGANEGNRLVALLDNKTVEAYFEDGCYYRGSEDGCDLLRPTKTVYANFYKGGYAVWHDSEQTARAQTRPNRIATAVPVEVLA